MKTVDQRQFENQVKDIVAEYKRIFPNEYEAVTLQIAKNRMMEADQKFGAVKGSDVLDRKLTEVPETLYIIFKEKLTEEQFTWMFNEPSKTGIRWFAKTFPEFRVAENI